jgi:hypothetical protein
MSEIIHVADEIMNSALEKEHIKAYNSGLDTAISLAEAVLKYSAPDLLETLVCGLENSKIKKETL